MAHARTSMGETSVLGGCHWRVRDDDPWLCLEARVLSSTAERMAKDRANEAVTKRIQRKLQQEGWVELTPGPPQTAHIGRAVSRRLT